MSLGRLSTVATARNVRAPTRRDLGSDLSDETARKRDVLIAAIPTEVIGFYTLSLAIIVGLVNEPTAAVPKPDQLVAWRWAAFGLMIGLIPAVFISAYSQKRKGRGRRFPVLELVAALVAGVAWGLSTPESPLFPHLNDDGQVIASALIGSAGAILVLSLAPRLRQQAH